MGLFRKSSRYPPLYEKPPAWREFGIEGIFVLVLAVVATAAFVLSITTREAFLVFALPAAGSPVTSFGAALESQPLLFYVLLVANAAIAVGCWSLIALFVKRRLND